MNKTKENLKPVVAYLISNCINMGELIRLIEFEQKELNKVIKMLEP